MSNKYEQKFDAVQLGSIYRSELRLRKKEVRNEFIEYASFIATIALLAWLFLWVL